jgi:Ca2+-binding EF-hand superfamily protein
MKMDKVVEREIARFTTQFNSIKSKLEANPGNKTSFGMESSRGEMTIQEFYRIREKYKISLTENDIDFLFKNFDSDNRNMVSWKELYSLFD